MNLPYKNLALSGGGVLGISYLGMLEYLYQINLVPQLTKIAGTSAGAITGCITAFNLPFSELKAISDSLDYRKVLVKDEVPEDSSILPRLLPPILRTQLNNLFDNIDCVYRLIKHYGWHSSSYIYSWLQEQIEQQFDKTLKPPPYTFADFDNTEIHKNQRPFKKLYVVATDVSKNCSVVFSSDTTPDLEVAHAVRISASVPLLFEAISTSVPTGSSEIYVDGGLIYNYPINLFDKHSPHRETLGAYFKTDLPPVIINNLVDFISATISSATSLQSALFENTKANRFRSIPILTGEIQPMNFSVTTGDDTYNLLYHSGYDCTKNFFSRKYKIQINHLV